VDHQCSFGECPSATSYKFLKIKKGHLEVLLEDINGKMGLLVEGHQTLTERIGRLEGKFSQKLDERTAQIRREILWVR